MAFFFKTFCKQRYIAGHVYEMLPVFVKNSLEQRSEPKNNGQVNIENNKTPPSAIRFAERNESVRFGHAKNRDFFSRTEGRHKWLASN